jgi:hypothetical protein
LFFVQGMPIEAICRELRLSRKVVRKVLRSKATEFHYERETQPLPKIGPWIDRLDQLLLANEANSSTSSDPTPSSRMLPSVIGSIGCTKRAISAADLQNGHPRSA